MNYLQLVNRAGLECGVASAQVTTLVGQTSMESLRFAGWVQDAWNDIQIEQQQWRFMTQTFSFNTTAGQQSYAPTVAQPTGCGLANFANWKYKSSRCYLTSTGYSDEQIQNYMDWDQFRNLYEYGNMRTTQQRPVIWAADPQKNYTLGPVPDNIYTIDGEYFMAPQVLSADTDTPYMPSQFHMAIVYGAMQSYAAYEAAPEVMQRGMAGWQKVMGKLRFDQLPLLTSGPPLA